MADQHEEPKRGTIEHRSGAAGDSEPPRGLAKITQAMAYLQVSRAKFNELMEGQHVRSVYIGRTRRVPWDDLYRIARDGV